MYKVPILEKDTFKQLYFQNTNVSSEGLMF